MNRDHLIRIGLLLSLGVGQLALAAPVDDPLKLTITSPEIVIRESNFTLEVTMTNRSPQPLTIVKSNPGCDFSAEVRDSNGRPVPLSEAGEELSRCEKRLALGRWIRVTLKPGESTDESYPIDLYYRLARPGSYTVQLRRELPARPGQLILSNEVVLNVVQ